MDKKWIHKLWMVDISYILRRNVYKFKNIYKGFLTEKNNILHMVYRELSTSYPQFIDKIMSPVYPHFLKIKICGQFYAQSKIKKCEELLDFTGFYQYN